MSPPARCGSNGPTWRVSSRLSHPGDGVNDAGAVEAPVMNLSLISGATSPQLSGTEHCPPGGRIVRWNGSAGSAASRPSRPVRPAAGRLPLTQRKQVRFLHGSPIPARVTLGRSCAPRSVQWAKGPAVDNTQGKPACVPPGHDVIQCAQFEVARRSSERTKPLSVVGGPNPSFAAGRTEDTRQMRLLVGTSSPLTEDTEWPAHETSAHAGHPRPTWPRREVSFSGETPAR
jgi:hypothetical protein